jgi:hypothetical protein
VVLDLVFYILERYSWRPDYIPGTNRGLPQMNFDAPRLLAHSFLFELDRFITTNNRGAYARFMDDIDVGVPSVGEAKQLIRDIDLVLQSRGVRLNSGKTLIMSAAEASEHYFVDENRFLDSIDYHLSRRLARSQKTGIPFDAGRLGRLSRSRFRKNLSIRGHYDRGNGDKVLKRHIGFLLRFGIDVPDAVLISCINNCPSLRDIAIRAICFKGYSRRRFDALKLYALSKYCVDEASVYFVAKALVDLKCPNGRKFRAEVREIIDYFLDLRQDAPFVSAMWLLAKFGTTTDIINKAHPVVPG